ncbi:BrnT family toxin [Candidatus Daviesbacteria bacterium]|nr:BrnT family toxin [Candidatus Daviesbacteria bacterium]
MKVFDWDEEKNAKLKKERGVGFEDVLTAIDEDRVLDRIDHPNQKRYPGQKIMIVKIDDYAYVVPFVEDEEKVFFKTIIPNRKATKKYLLREEGK